MGNLFSIDTKGGAKKTKKKTKKSKVMLPIPKHFLGDFGYSPKLTIKERNKALDKAIKKASPQTVIIHLNLLRILVKNTQPHNYKKYTRDMKYVQKILKKLKKTSSRK